MKIKRAYKFIHEWIAYAFVFTLFLQGCGDKEVGGIKYEIDRDFAEKRSGDVFVCKARSPHDKKAEYAIIESGEQKVALPLTNIEIIIAKFEGAEEVYIKNGQEVLTGLYTGYRLADHFKDHKLSYKFRNGENGDWKAFVNANNLNNPTITDYIVRSSLGIQGKGRWEKYIAYNEIQQKNFFLIRGLDKDEPIALEEGTFNQIGKRLIFVNNNFYVLNKDFVTVQSTDTVEGRKLEDIVLGNQSGSCNIKLNGEVWEI